MAYDNSVRDSAGNVIQFMYGEDGQDPCKAALLDGKSAGVSFSAEFQSTDAQVWHRGRLLDAGRWRSRQPANIITKLTVQT